MSEPLEGVTALIADDEPGIRSGCRRVLESRGVLVEVAGTGAEALDRLLSGPIDVAIVDLIMPTFGGMELLGRMAEAELTVVPIVITAHASIATVVEAMKQGAFDYLPKPFVPEELIVRVERAVAYQRLRQEAQARLLQLDADKSQLHTIVTSLADGVLVVNRDGEVVMTNPAARAALEMEGAGGEPAPVGRVVGSERLRELIAEVGRSGGGACAVGAEIACGDRVYMARVAPIITGSGEALGSATVLRDVTELMSLERAKSQFVSMVAHELKAPLAAVQGYLKVILSGQEMTAEKQEEVLGRCSQRIEGMAQMVRDLLDLSHAEAMPLRRMEPLALGPLCGEIVEQNQPLAEPLGVSLRLDLPAEELIVQADRDDLVRMIGNLVSNAIKYNRPGGRVTVSARAGEGALRLAVTDTGLGIPPEALPRLGEEFFRINAPERRGIVGTGLGLALIKRTLAVYHGRLEVESVVGSGSTFTLVLPR
jgi:signal transduction histidine kinase